MEDGVIQIICQCRGNIFDPNFVAGHKQWSCMLPPCIYGKTTSRRLKRRCHMDPSVICFFSHAKMTDEQHHSGLRLPLGRIKCYLTATGPRLRSTHPMG